MRCARTAAGWFGAALVALLAYATCAAYGGIAPSGVATDPADQLPTSDKQLTADAIAAAQSLNDVALLPSFSHGVFGLAQPLAALPSDVAPAAASLRELPPAPSSMALVLSALATLGAYQGVRSVKRLHLNFTPDWYHTGGPTQIGHATPFDLEFGGALPVCEFDEPVARPAFTYRIPREICSRLRSQFLLLTESPRGPPVHPSFFFSR